MKTRNFLIMGLLGLGMMTACTNDDEAVNVNPNDGDKALTQISVSIASSNGTATRTVTGNTGDEIAATDAENNIETMTIVLANANDIAQYIYTPDLETEITTNKEIRTTKPFEVPAGSYKVYVLANYSSKEGATNSITEIKAGSTNMKEAVPITSVGGIQMTATDQSKYYTFLMTNAEDVPLTTFTTNATGNEKDDDGTDDLSGGETNVNLLNIKIERVCSKVTFGQYNEENNATKKLNVIDANNNIIATAEVEGASVININKTTFLTKVIDNTVNPTTPGWSNTANPWFYVKDPNYEAVDANKIQSNFWNVQVSTDNNYTENAKFVGLDDKLYCAENTMVASAQLNGQSTGVMYKVKYTPSADAKAATDGGNATVDAYTTLVNGGTDVYSAMFTEVLAVENKNSAITADMFTNATVAEDGSFYEYKGLLFKDKNTAVLFYAIDNALKDNTATAATVNTTFGTYVGENASELPTDIHCFAQGYAYYTAWIKHNPTTTGNMEAGKYGVVRNHWYDLTVTGITSLGYYKPEIEDPTQPDDPVKAKIQVSASIKKWVLVKQNVSLGQ